MAMQSLCLLLLDLCTIQLPTLISSHLYAGGELMEYLSSVPDSLKELERKYNFSSFNLKTMLQLKKATGTRRDATNPQPTFLSITSAVL